LAKIVAEISGGNPEVVVRTGGLAPEYTAENSLLLSEMSGYEFSDVRSCIRELYEWYGARESSIDAQSLRFDE